MSKYELTFRRTKGSPVTSDEIDQNFKNIKIGHDSNDLRIRNLEDFKINSLSRLEQLEEIDSDNRLSALELKILEDGFATQSYVDNAVLGKDSTDEITEGDTNLYYTDTRVEEYLTSNNYTQEAWVNQQITVLTGTVTELTTTDGITEGSSNLYYTDERSRSSISVDGDLSYDSTTGIISYVGPTDFYTQSEVESLITDRIAEVASGNISLTGYATETYADETIDSKTTDDLTEGTTNLYYTDERSRSSISVDGDLSYDSTTGVISYSEDLTNYYTQSETDAKISERITEVASGDITLTGYATESYADATIDSKTTDDLIEGTTNLYYTESRVADFLTDNNYATKLFVTTTVNNTIFQSNFATVATSGSYNDLSDVPTIVSHFTNDSNYITLEDLSVSGDLSYDNTTGTISYSQPTNISVFTNDSNYLVDSDIRQEFTDITNRLDVLEEYTILDVYKNMYKNTSVGVQYIEFSIRLVDAFRMNWLASGQSDPAWDNLVDDIYNNDAAAIEQAFSSMPVLDQTVFLMPLLYTINSGVTLVNQALGTTYDTVTLDELNNSFPQWQQRNSGYEASANTLNSQLVQADRTFIKNILKNNSYADFTRDTVVSGWNPS